MILRGTDSFYRSGYFASALLLYAGIVVTEACLVSGPVSAGILVLLALPLLDGSIFLFMRLKALNAGRHVAPPGTVGHLPAISVIMPSYEEPFDVKKMTLDSILAMDYPGRLEVISVDNSPDTRSDEFTRWRDHLATLGVPFIHNPDANALKPGNLDVALRAATGEYVVFVDVDSTMPRDPAFLTDALQDFAADPRLGFVQFHVVPTNGHFNALTRGVARFQHLHNAVDIVGGMGGFTLFKGHNAIWRRSALDAVGSWREELGGRVILAEDFLKSFHAYTRGYHGRVSWVPTGEWIPSSLAAFTSMWHRWIYGTIQVAVKNHLGTLWRAPGFTVFEKIEVLRRVKFGAFFLPYLAVAGALAFPDPVFVPYLGLLAAVLGAGLFVSARLGPRSDEASFRSLAVTAMAEHFVSWVGFTASLRFAADAFLARGGRTAWTVTAKGIERRPGFVDLLKKNGAVDLVHAVLVVVSAYLLATSANPGEIFIRLYALTYFLTILLLPVCLGRVGRVPDNDTNSATVDPHPEVSHA